MRWHYTVAAQTDVGTTKTVNQDCLTVKVANTIYGEAAFAVMCDGMGGLEQGEVASTMVVRAYEQWFLRELPQLCQKAYRRTVLDRYGIVWPMSAMTRSGLRAEERQRWARRSQRCFCWRDAIISPMWETAASM